MIGELVRWLRADQQDKLRVAVLRSARGPRFPGSPGTTRARTRRLRRRTEDGREPRQGARVAGDIDTELARRLTPSGVAELHRLLAKLLDHPSADT